MSIVNLVGGPSILLNLILVDAEVRPAMMIQPVDVGEWLPTDPITSGYISNIKKHFPHFKYSDTYTPFQGIIISKRGEYNGEYIDSHKMGKILGYPGYNDFEIIQETRINPYAEELNINIISVWAVVEKLDEKVNLFSNGCIGDRLLSEFEHISQQAMIAFNDPMYEGFLCDLMPISVNVLNEPEISATRIIYKIKGNEQLTNLDMDSMVNCLWNLGDTTGISEHIADKLYDPLNDIHNGVIMMILLGGCIENYDRSSPIYGQKSPELDHYSDIRVKWFEAIQKIFIITRKHTSIFSKIFNYINPKRMLVLGSDPLITIMDNVYKKRALTTVEKNVIYTRLCYISPTSRKWIRRILSEYDHTNNTHIGIMLVFILDLVPQYDVTLPLHNIDPVRYEYIRFKEISNLWIREVYDLFTTNSLV